MNHTYVDKDIAKKYATAFIKVFFTSITFADINRIEKAQKFLQTHKRTLFFLQLPQFDHKIREAMVADLVNYFSLPMQLSTIILLLIDHNRSYYIPEVLSFIIILYREQTGSIQFVCTSSQVLNEEQIESIKKFLERYIHKNITCVQSINPSLIAGIRLQSNNYLWEHSVYKHIQALYSLKNRK
ncbi:MAG TPA: F0F1 ATP synthase subunit delta [Candidatus Babeliales bacterium]|nr:F0F1 ATP synthase subunit delta [Candidatus Babeliales bacterium]